VPYSSLALISARQTLQSLEVLSILISSYIYTLCQALDLRAMQHEFNSGLETIVSEEFGTFFKSAMLEVGATQIEKAVITQMKDSFEATSTMDAVERMKKVANSCSTQLLQFFVNSSFSDPAILATSLGSIPQFQACVAQRLTTLLHNLRREYLRGGRGPAPASPYLNKTRPVYEFVRKTLGIRMHGSENYHYFANGLGEEDETVGQNVSLIHEAIRDGKMHSVVAQLF